MVSPSADYTFGGWCLILVGITATPTKVRFVCRTCNGVVETVTDVEEIKQIRIYG
jgi:3,4-dihydroxy-2-butanone 4-phosphate synthase